MLQCNFRSYLHTYKGHSDDTNLRSRRQVCFHADVMRVVGNDAGPTAMQIAPCKRHTLVAFSILEDVFCQSFLPSRQQWNSGHGR